MFVHEVLWTAARLVRFLGIASLLIPFFTCILMSMVHGPDSLPITHPATWLFCGLLILVFIAPGVALVCCGGPINRGGKSAVTVALVISCVMVPVYLFGLVQHIAQLVWYARWRDNLPPARILVGLMINVILFGGFIMAIVKLARCYRVVSELGLAGRRGFEPLLNDQVREPPPPGEGDWPQISQ